MRVDLWGTLVWNNFGAHKLGGIFLPPKKMGRPTDNPKRHEIKARIDEECYRILNAYCQEERKPKAEGIRDGIKKLEAELNKK